MQLLTIALLLTGQLVLAAEQKPAVNQPIPPELSAFMSLDLEDRDPSWVTGFDENGKPVQDPENYDDEFSFSDSEFPDFSTILSQRRPRDDEEKPLNKERIIQQSDINQFRDNSDEGSDWDDWETEYNPTQESSFYTGEGAQDTEDVTLQPSTSELDSYLKTENSESASGFSSATL